MKLAAITGSIGCGKTTLAELAREMGFVVFDVDKWSRSLYKRSDYIRKIAEVFPETADKNGFIDKRKLRDVVFNDYSRLKELEEIAHPFLKEKLKKHLYKNRFSEEIFFIDAALLFEAGWDKYCDLVIVADVDYETQKCRVMKRDGITAKEFENINGRQMPNKEKILRGDVIVETDLPLNQLKVELMCLIDELSEE